VLYGKLDASNQDIVKAVEVANAREFIESETLSHKIVDDPTSLRTFMMSEDYKQQVIEEISEQKYDSYLETLTKLMIK